MIYYEIGKTNFVNFFTENLYCVTFTIFGLICGIDYF